MPTLTTLAAAAALSAAVSAFAAPAVVYETGTSDPWGNTTNDAAMDAAFGAGAWRKSNGFELADFGGARFVFLDGSDAGSLQLQAFLAAGRAQIEGFVAGGGRIFINDAPNVGSGFDLGFGGVALDYGPPASETTQSYVAVVNTAGVAAGLTAGGIPDSYSGFVFSSAVLSGPLVPLLVGSHGTILGAEDFGAGLAVFGTQTTPNFHSTGGDLLLVNELRFAAGEAASPVPETGSTASIAASLLVAGLAGRMRRPRKGAGR